MKTNIELHTPKGTISRDIEPKWTDGKIHIYCGGMCGYKLSIGNRHLTLAELVSVVNLYNAHQD